MSMNETLHITQRIDVGLSILNSITFQGYHEIKAIAPEITKAMEVFAGIGQDISKYEAESGEENREQAETTEPDKPEEAEPDE